MTSATQPAGGGGAVERPSATGLADVIDSILDKGLVIDAYVRVSLVGIELLTVDARVVVASVDTYLRFAEAVNRLDLSEQGEGLPGLMQGMNEGGAEAKTKGAAKGAIEAGKEKLQDFVEDDEQEREEARGRQRRRRER